MHLAMFFHDCSKFAFEIYDLFLTNRGCAFNCLVDNLDKLRIKEVFGCDTNVEFGSEFVN